MSNETTNRLNELLPELISNSGDTKEFTKKFRKLIKESGGTKGFVSAESILKMLIRKRLATHSQKDWPPLFTLWIT